MNYWFVLSFWMIVLWCDKHWFERLYKYCISSACYGNRLIHTKIDLKGWNNPKKTLRYHNCVHVCWRCICKISNGNESNTSKGMIRMQNYRKSTFGLTLNGEPWKWKNNYFLLLVILLTWHFLQPQVQSCHRFKGRALLHPAYVQKL